MRDTPRTDSAWETLPSVYEFIAEVKKLERELNAANDRIKRLEEAGNELYDGWRGYRCNRHKYLDAWTKAKEAKP